MFIEFSLVISRVESSAERIVLRSVDIWVVTFIYKRKRIGPKTLPCGTQYLMGSR